MVICQNQFFEYFENQWVSGYNTQADDREYLSLILRIPPTQVQSLMDAW